MRANAFTLKPTVVALALTFGLFAVPMIVDYGSGDGVSAIGTVYAEDDGSAKGAQGPRDGMGHKGQGGPAQGVGGAGKGQGGPSGDSDAKGPRYGGEGSKPAPGTSGGRPAWASQELTDIGRLNVARAPAQVLDRSLLNAVAELQVDGVYNVAFYDAALNILKTSADPVADLKLLLSNPTTVRVDSPLANLAFYKAILTTGVIADGDGNVVWSVAPADRELAAAIFIASASDKTKTVTAPVVHAVDVIFEFPSEVGSTATTNPDLAQDEALAATAESVRTAIYEVHEGL
jgi:hypothetical protein